MAKCPNKSHPDWKTLVAKHGGEKGAYLQYVKNGFEIPSQDSIKKTNKKLTIRERVGTFGNYFKSKDTLDSLEKHPNEAIKMIDELNQIYPDIRVFKDRIIDENGNYLEIPSDKMGRHYRSAFLSAVAWSNDSSFETPPHEYAHEYIDMYRNIPIVAKAIEKYGEERLVTLIARKYAGQKMSNSFEKFLVEFWKTIRLTFASPSMVDILTDSFAKNERLGEPLSRGTAVHNFQDIANPKIEKDTVFNFDNDTKKAKNPIELLTREQIEGVVNKSLIAFGLVKKKDTSNSIDIGKMQLTNTIINIKNDFKSALSKSFIKLKDSSLISRVKSKIQNFVSPELNSKTKDETISLINKIQKEGKEFSLSSDNSIYQGKGLKLERQSNFILRLKGKTIDSNENLKKGASVGNLVDIIGRDVFDGKIKSLSEYISIANQMNKENDYKVEMTEAEFRSLVNSFNKIKVELEKQEMTIISNDVFVYRKFSEEEKKETGLDGVGGTLDLVAVDKNGNVHIIDFKNKKLVKGNEKYLLSNIFEGGSIGSEKIEADVDKWADQQSTYKILMESNNIPVATTNILPVSTSYDTKSQELEIDDISKLDKWWLTVKRKAASVTKLDKGATSDATNYSSMDQSIIDVVEDVIVGNDENKKAIVSKIKGDKIDLTKEQQRALDNIYNLVQGTLHREVTNLSYINPNVASAERIDEDVIEDKGIEEVENQIEHKEQRRLSKNKIVQWIEERITKQLKWITNSRLWAKYLSGSENSIISRVLYKGLNDGREGSSQFTHDFLDLIGLAPVELNEGSAYENKNSTIDELETETIELDKVKNGDLNVTSIKLTKAELLMIYLMNRQDGGRANLDEGFHLNTIKGRTGKRKNKYKLTDKQINDIISKVESDPDSKEFIAKIDEAMEYNHQELNSVYRLLEGFDLEKVKYYFPMFHGEEKLGVSKRKSIIADMRNLRLRSAKGMSVRLVDPFQALESMRRSNAAYVGYAIPIHNAQKMIQKLKSESLDDIDNGDYIKFLEDNINQIQDSSLLYSGQGGSELGQWMNKLQGNFAVALLAYNPGVIFKQQISLETAATMIHRKYIRMSGASLGGLNFINPMKLLKRLSYTGISEGETALPIEWKQITDDPLYKILIKYPLFRDRLEGMITRETGEAVMSRRAKEDLITIPFKKGKDGKPLQISKSRLMMGITMMDSVTIMRLFEAVKLETQDRMHESKFVSLSEADIELHNINRLQQIIDGTQPTFDQTNRSGLAKSSDPVVRPFTMFSSATQKIAEQLIDSMIDYNLDPSSDNLKKLGLRAFHTAVTTSIMLTTIDILFSLAKGNWDDDDLESIPEQYAWGSLTSSVGSLHVLGTAVKGIISEMDSKPWRQTVQDPVISIFQEGYGVFSNAFKGNFLKSFTGAANVTFKANGIPITPIVFTKNYLEKIGDN